MVIKRKVGRRVSIDGVVYDSVTVAALAAGVPTGTAMSRLLSKGSRWSSWQIIDDKPVRDYSDRKAFKYPIQWCTYTLTHVLSNKAYVGATQCFPARRATHKHGLGSGTHKSPLLLKSFQDDPDWNNWAWHLHLHPDQESALKMEEDIAGYLAGRGLLLNSSTNTRAPIYTTNKTQAHKDRTKAWALDHRDAMVKRGAKGLKRRWKDRENREAWCGAGNPFAKPVTVDGVRYGSVKDAERALRINEKTIRTRARSDAYPSYHFD